MDIVFPIPEFYAELAELASAPSTRLLKFKVNQPRAPLCHAVHVIARHPEFGALVWETRESVPVVEEDPVFEVSAEPRGAYTGITAFVERKNEDAVLVAAETIENELEFGGIRTLINVRTRTKAAS